MCIQVSVNITKPLKKIIVLKQQVEEDILMPVVYERLPNFCYSCGCIGHQFRECKEYRDQKKEELPFRLWLKAISLADRTKLNKSRGKGSKEHERSKEDVVDSKSAETSNPVLPSLNPGQQNGPTQEPKQQRRQ